ncbi:fumarylacetoacetate hydrolase family protein [Nocardia sp. BMG111209]|uniref:fumarylacetoacetate hydrolase family protein n=1 Tax=Nocardia sp. BMG111209 TaxID=1160137 RepID=UPI000365CB20|nr:fumarylacetoacetate hydrolase family protein [Nocardia sp. BMG111209]
MKLANLAGRLAIITAGGAVDVERTSGGEFDADPQGVFEQWDSFVEWVTSIGDLAAMGCAYDPLDLRAPAPWPRQIFAMGFNYRAHAEEFGTTVHTGLPPVFTKFAGSITGPYGSVVLPADTVDWEVELVAVLGRRAWQVGEDRAWQCVAGLTVGQDLSERETQLRGDTPQFSLGKSYPGFSPMGPWLVTPEEFDNPHDLRITTELNGVLVQDARTSHMITAVPALISRLSRIVPLLPGDVVYTGTPSGVGSRQHPPRFLRPGDELVSTIAGIGALRHHMIAGPTSELTEGNCHD